MPGYPRGVDRQAVVCWNVKSHREWPVFHAPVEIAASQPPLATPHMGVVLKTSW